jgi:chorismate synthase
MNSLQRSEFDQVHLQSGTEHGVTLGTPIGLLVQNKDQRPHDYAETDLYPRPSHADYTYLAKYGVKASSGGGRASARETIGRVAAGAIAEKYLKEAFGVEIVAFVGSVGKVALPYAHEEDEVLGKEYLDLIKTITRAEVDKEITRCPHKETSAKMEEVSKAWRTSTSIPKVASASFRKEPGGVDVPSLHLLGFDYFNAFILTCLLSPSPTPSHRVSDLLPYRLCTIAGTMFERSVFHPHRIPLLTPVQVIRAAKARDDSLGGTVTCVIRHCPLGLGEPAFDKLEAVLAHAMLSIPSTKGFEIGSGFRGSTFPGSQHNDPFVDGTHGVTGEKQLRTTTNWSGGIQGGISNGEDIYFR